MFEILIELNFIFTQIIIIKSQFQTYTHAFIGNKDNAQYARYKQATLFCNSIVQFQIQKMNMKKLRELQDNVKNLLWNQIQVKIYDSYALRIISTIPYILNYLVLTVPLLYSLVSSLVQTQWKYDSTINTIIFSSLQATKILLGFSFIIIQNQISYISIKICNILLLLTTTAKLSLIWINVLANMLQTLTSIVWVLKKEKRINSVNWDARWTFLPLWIKQITIIVLLPFYHYNMQPPYILCFVLILQYLWNNQETIYNFRVLHAFKCCDISLLICYGIYFWVSQPHRSLKIALSIFIVLVVLLKKLLKYKNNNRIFYIIERKIFQNKNIILLEEEFLSYCWSLSDTIRSKDAAEIIRAVKYHQQLCKISNCPIWYKMKQQNNAEEKQFLIKILGLYLNKFMIKYQGNRTKLRDYIIYQLTPSSKALKFLQPNNLFHFRQIKRLAESVDNNQHNRDFQSTISKSNQLHNQISQLLFLILQKRTVFLNTIQNSTINLDRLFREGLSMTVQENKLKNYQKVNKILSSPSRFWISMFFRIILNQKNQQFQQIEDPPYFFSRMTQPQPIILVAAEGTKYTQILKTTKAVQKLLYYTQSQLLSFKISDLIPPQMKEEHAKMLENKLSKLANFQGINPLESTMYLTTKFGHIIPGKTYIHRLQGFSQRKWSVVFEQLFHDDSIIIIKDDGTLLGINQNSSRFGFHPQMVGKQIKKLYLNHFKKVSSIIVLPYEQYLFFDEDQSSHTCDLNLCRIQEVVYFIKYYVVLVNKRINTYNRRMGRQNTIAQECEKGTPNAFRKFIAPNQTYDVNLGTFQYEQNNFQQSQKTPKIYFQNNQEKSVSTYDILSALGFKVPNSELPNQQPQKTIDYKGDIITMIYNKGNFDYKQNYEIYEFQDNDFKAFPYKKKKIPANLDQKFYTEFLKDKQNKTPNFLKISFLMLIIINILNFLAISTIFIFEVVNVDIAVKNTARNDLVNYLFAHYIQVSISPLYQNFLPNYVAHQKMKQLLKQIIEIEKQFAQEQQSTNKLFRSPIQYIDPQTMQNITSQLQKSKKEYLIYVEKALKDASQYWKLNQYTIRALYPIVNQVNKRSTRQYVQSVVTYKQTIIILLFLPPVFLLCSIIYYCIISYKMFIEKKSSLTVFKDIDNCTIQKQLVKASKFGKMIQQNKIISQQEQEKVSIDKFRTIKQTLQFMVKLTTDRNLYATNLFKWKLQPEKLQLKHKQQQIIRKKVTSNARFLKDVWILILLYVGSLSIVIYSLNSNIQYVKQLQSDLKFQYRIYSVLDSSQLFLMSMNNSTKNEAKYYWKMMIEQFNLIQQDLYQVSAFSNSFMIFFYQIWYENMCRYLQESTNQCKENKRGFWDQGISQIFSLYIRRGNAALTYEDSSAKQLMNLKQLLNLQAQLYLPLIKVVKQKLQEQIRTSWNLGLINCIVVLVIETILILFWLEWSMISLKKKYQQGEIIEKLFLKFPFQQLIEIPSYQRYITEKMKLVLN